DHPDPPAHAGAYGLPAPGRVGARSPRAAGFRRGDPGRGRPLRGVAGPEPAGGSEWGEMTLLLLAVATLLLGGLLALLTGQHPRLCSACGALGAVLGGVLGIIPAARVLLGGVPESLRWAWDVPYGSFFVALDPLSAFFVLPVLGLTALAAVYGSEYLDAYRGH